MPFRRLVWWDDYDKMEQLDIVSEKLLQEDQEYMEERKD